MLSHTYAVAGSHQVTVTLNDEDGGTSTDTFIVNPPSIEFGQADFETSESVGTSMVVVLNRNTTGVISQVRLEATGGTAQGGNADFTYTALPLLVTFEEDETSKVIPIDIIDETLVELDETITLEVFAVNNVTIGTQNTATLTILNDDSAEFTVSSESGNEDDGAITFTVNLSNPVDVAISVQGGRLRPGAVERQRLWPDHWSDTELCCG